LQKYEGNFRDGDRHGDGTYYYKNGNKYVGEFQSNEMHGKGSYYFSDGDVFQGSIEHGKFVTGVYRYVNGQIYEGGKLEANSIANYCRIFP
jgi:hypothetical protein